MVDWIEPLNLEKIIVSVFSGSQEIFLAVALFFIFGMAGYFKMNMLATFFMVVTFLVMFHSFVPSYLLIMIGMFGGLILGNWVSKIVKG